MGRPLQGAGQFEPETEAGQQLLAHELGHAVNQIRAGQPRVQRWTTEADFQVRGPYPGAAPQFAPRTSVWPDTSVY